MWAVHVDSLKRSYGTAVAVDGVSFVIRPGEIFGLLGPNGAGKTTTLHMIAGLCKPDGGQVCVEGQRDPTRPEVRRRIGLAPQTVAIYEGLTGEENVAFFGRLYGLGGKGLQERVQWALAFVGLNQYRKQKAGSYSGGMQRRLNLACALVHEPTLLLLDEPTVGVDPQSRNLIFEKIEALKKRGVTVLYTTHSMEEAQRLCDRVAILDRGQLLAEDTVEGLICRFGGLSVVSAQLEQIPDGIQLPGELQGSWWRLETQHPLEEIARLASMGVTFRSLKVDRPDLERVFLTLTGRRLRDSWEQ